MASGGANGPVLAEYSEARSHADLAYEQIRDRLVLLDIRPGEPINDGRLASELGVGRTPVREALKRLEIDHLVVSFPRRGTFATTIDVTELGAISVIREQLEPLAARQAALQAPAQMRERLQNKVREVRALDASTSDRISLMRLDTSVHRLIYRAAGNPHLEEVLVRYDNLATRIWCLVLDKLPDLAHHVSGQAALLDAVIAGDSDQAERLSHQHMAEFEREIRQVL